MFLLCGFTFSCLWVFGLGQLEQPEISITKAIGESAQIACKVPRDLGDTDIHWYRQKENQQFDYLIYDRQSYNQRPLDGINKKIEVRKDSRTSTSTLTVNFLKKEDEAFYYCAVWTFTDQHGSRNFQKGQSS